MNFEDIIAVLIVFCIVLLATVMFVFPHFEARAFNKFSDTKVTYWDAFGADLRIAPDRLGLGD